MLEAAADFIVLVASDRRADDGRRVIAVTRDRVLIERCVAGVKMRIAVPIAAFRGIALAPRFCGGRWQHVVMLDHRDRELCVELDAGSDGAAMARRQKRWASVLGTRSLAADAARPTPRRRGSAVAPRRPRLLRRRKPGDARRLAAVFAGEREIICYE